MIYWIGWFFFKIIYRAVWRLKISGLENIPQKTAAIIASNHLSLADPPLVGCCIKRKIYFMAKKELFDIPVFSWILKLVNAFPVNRDQPDPNAIRRAIKLLSKRNIVLIFPQGGRRKQNTTNYDIYKYGLGIISCWSGKPVIPCRIDNTDKLNKFKRIKVEFMKPIYPSSEFKNKKEYLKIAELWAQKVLQ